MSFFLFIGSKQKKENTFLVFVIIIICGVFRLIYIIITTRDKIFEKKRKEKETLEFYSVSLEL
jgi:hypothetical protein